MAPQRDVLLRSLVAAGLLFAVGACNDDETTGDVSLDPTDPAAIQSFLQSNFGKSETFLDAFARLVTAATGGPADGVSISFSSPTQVGATVDIDLDGDGTRETTASGGAVLAQPGTLDGAQVSLNSVTGRPLASVGATISFTQTEAIVLDGIFGQFTDLSQQTNLLITQGTVTVDPVGETLNGSVSFEILAGENFLFGDVFFEDNGQGGWQMRVAGEGFEFIVG